MNTFFFNKIFQKDGWKENTKISTDSDGRVTSIEENSSANDSDIKIPIGIPGFVNSHSHAFQYAMAGITENHHSNTSSNFWTWRNAMYDLALNISPDEMQKIATMLYNEMLRNGYTQVAEFHYLHHDKSGNYYENRAEMSERLLLAAKDVGIEITIIPICYSKGGFGANYFPEQKRFISKNSNDYFKLFESTLKVCKNYKTNIGIGVHSLRAVDANCFKEINEFNNSEYPFHLHISEQKKEVNDALKFLGERPVEWLFNNNNIGENHHLVHATHLTKRESKLITKNKSNIVLCPITEGNLADGLFNFAHFQENNGYWSIGSDSHVGLSPLEEIRLLDYGQRVNTNKRNTFKNSKGSNSGEIALKATFFNGNKAMGTIKENFYEINQPLHFLEIDDKTPLIDNTSNKNIINTLIYSSNINAIKNNFTFGKCNLIDKEKNERIKRDFKETMLSLNNR